MENYIKELAVHSESILKILDENGGRLGITKLIEILKKRINMKAAICRDAIIATGAKGIVKITKNPPNQIVVELLTQK